MALRTEVGWFVVHRFSENDLRWHAEALRFEYSVALEWFLKGPSSHKIVFEEINICLRNLRPVEILRGWNLN